MSCIPTKPIRTVAYCLALGLLATSVVAFAQDSATTPPPSSAPNPGWHSFSNPPADNRGRRPLWPDATVGPAGQLPASQLPAGQLPAGPSGTVAFEASSGHICDGAGGPDAVFG